MHQINLIFPHQLFEKSPLFVNQFHVWLVETDLFFRQYAFHKQKLLFHRASMSYYATYLRERGFTVHYIEGHKPEADIRTLIPRLVQQGVRVIHYIDPTDDWLSRRLKHASEKAGINLKSYQSPLFLNSINDLSSFFKPGKQQFSQTDFYKKQRKKRNILLSEDQKPVGGKWTYDTENRKKYPKKKQPPVVHHPVADQYFEEAVDYVKKHFSHNPGSIPDKPLYPYTHQSAKNWFSDFLTERFSEFGTYEDAIVKDAHFLHHSALTPMLNTGLITPEEVLVTTLNHATKNSIPLNSTEGFIRQIVGWREFMRGLYQFCGSDMRTRNFWNFHRKIPSSFYEGTTGIEPVDSTIKKLLNTAYLHHIERLMVVGNFMLLCEFHPDEVYRWFMELFIDAYDWVMVPNVYGMSQFADGGSMATKPYISGSNYLMKMSDFARGDWQATWDGLFWRFMHVHRNFFIQNPRLSMLVRTFDKMDTNKRQMHLENAEKFLSSI
ncbi:cryptochrome/photolyase family protein [Salinivirga cyanobacteriivorans]